MQRIEATACLRSEWREGGKRGHLSRNGHRRREIGLVDLHDMAINEQNHTCWRFGQLAEELISVA